jgi:hypothetical protein
MNILEIVNTHLLNTQKLFSIFLKLCNSNFEELYHGIMYSLGSCDIFPGSTTTCRPTQCGLSPVAELTTSPHLPTLDQFWCFFRVYIHFFYLLHPHLPNSCMLLLWWWVDKIIIWVIMLLWVSHWICTTHICSHVLFFGNILICLFCLPNPNSKIPEGCLSPTPQWKIDPFVWL